MPPVNIRAATASDLPVLGEIFRRASLSNHRDREALLAHPEALELSGAAIAEGRTRVAVGPNDEVVGFITTLAISDTALEIEDLFTEPDWMRRGVARRLVMELVSAVEGSGVRRIEVTGNPHASEFYSHMGFIHDHDTQTEFGPAARLCLTLDAARLGSRDDDD